MINQTAYESSMLKCVVVKQIKSSNTLQIGVYSQLIENAFSSNQTPKISHGLWRTPVVPTKTVKFPLTQSDLISMFYAQYMRKKRE